MTHIEHLTQAVAWIALAVWQVSMMRRVARLEKTLSPQHKPGCYRANFPDPERCFACHGKDDDPPHAT